jgi:cell division protein FtsZ
VTVIAAGFDGGGPVRRNDDRALGHIAGSTQRPATTPGRHATTPGAPQQSRVVQPSEVKPPVFLPVPVPGGTQTPAGQTPGNGAQPPAVHPQPSEPVPVAMARPPRTVIFDDNDDLDVPDFLK